MSAGTADEQDPEADKARFAALYRDNVREVYRYLHRRCRDTQLAEDLTQDVFLSALRTPRPLHEITAGWLITASRNRLVDVVRRRDRYSAKLVLLAGGLEEEQADATAVDRIVLEAALDHLSVDHRLVLTLHYLDQMTAPELARELGRTQKSVEGLLARARRSLQRELERSDD